MKKLIIILLFFSSLILSANTYYVSTTGVNGAYPTRGTLANPWLTWQYGFSQLVAGDTLYIRGGTYNIPVLTGVGVSATLTGTVSDSIHILNYPGEIPILDCIGVTSGTENNGLSLEVSYVKIKGLTVRNVWQIHSGDNAYGIYLYGNHTIIENCTVYNVGGSGYFADQCDELYFINCDVHDCYDSLGDPEGGAGNDGYGFNIHDASSSARRVYYRDCRAWKNGDDGFVFWSLSYAELDGCWSFYNGKLTGAGDGFKLGFPPAGTPPVLQRKMINCIAANNRAYGITTNDAGYYAMPMQVYNNTSYHNGYFGEPGFPYTAIGVVVYNTTSSDAGELGRIFRNNISYANEMNVFVGGGALYTHDHNTWDASVTVTNADFVSIDSTGISGARQADGSLPVLNFLKLASSFDLIDAGTELGYGNDIGAYQYSEPGDPIDPVVIYTNSVTIGTATATTGGNVIDDGGGTVSARGVAYGSSANPTIAGTHTHDGTGTGTFVSSITGLTAATTYHVRAYATNEYGTGYGADVEFTTNSESGLSGDFVFSGGKPVYSNGKQVIK